MKLNIVLISCIIYVTFTSPRSSGQHDSSLQNSLPFSIGAAVDVNLLKNNQAYRAVVTKEYDSLTGENAMKFGTLHPGQDTWNWEDADYLVSYAQANNKRVYGHTLIWYKSLPSWVTNFNGDAAAWDNLLKTHIQTVVTRYKSKVASWDVVNEEFEDDTIGTHRNSIWRQHLGDDYIARSFRYAHEADPAAVLFYNDYGNEWGPSKRKNIIKLVNGLKDRGIPIHGIGMQMHTRYTQTDDNHAQAISTAVGTGLQVHISELDIAMNPEKNPNKQFTAELANIQSQKYEFISKTYNAIPKNQQFGITFWNVGDADSWIPAQNKVPDWPCLFDKDYNRKPAYNGVVQGVK